jgi:hypothetical protein
LYDFRHGHSLLVEDAILSSSSAKPDMPRPNSRKVLAPWNSPGLAGDNYWDVHRAVAAFHVYVHLGLFCMVAHRRATELEMIYGRVDRPLPGMTEARRAFERAQYLGEAIKQACWQDLGLAGQGLIEWLGSILDAIDLSPPPKGSVLHLLLERYLKEAGRVDYVRHTLVKLLDEEVRAARQVLVALNADAEAGRFEVAVAQLLEGGADGKLGEVRRLIANTLLSLSPDGYQLAISEPASVVTVDVVKDMIERSSRRLAASIR